MQINLVSTNMIHTPGMVSNYLYAVEVKDDFFINVFEMSYSDHHNSKEIFEALRNGDYTVEGHSLT